MNNFVFQNPTKLIFGKGTIARLAREIPGDKTVMVTYGGGSVKKNGIYDQVTAALKNHRYIEFWGIEPNPSVETLRQAVALGKEHHVDYLLAVGGGSVLDGTKLISVAIPYSGDAWELVLNAELLGDALPVASVMTMPATGSEMNAGAVISNKTTQEKFAFNYKHPQFAILDPETTYSIPAFHIACGLADTFVHVMEQYMTTPDQSWLTDRWAEGILLNVVEIAPKIAENKHDYHLMSEYMLSATLALNGLISMGVTQDWVTHMIGHELTAIHGITHGQSLAIVLPATMTVLQAQKRGKILQYGERVWGITTGTPTERVLAAIDCTEQFFRSLNLATHLNEVQIGEETIAEVERRFNERKVALGEACNVNGAIARAILEACL
ncbi:MAG: iron-containing alcohol dehydrogenase [Prevotellaceae bacterium]|jgi:NADP-dependent alcohol dehydrogenase|nr:iron-containing alcohol dehydrogenase [Prevotellaceae bacterium]